MAKVVFCIGNGQTRSSVDLIKLRPHGKIYGCNGLYRDFAPDVLCSVDGPMMHEIYQSGYAYAHECYFRNWNIQEEKMFHTSVYGTNDPEMIKYNKLKLCLICMKTTAAQLFVVI